MPQKNDIIKEFKLDTLAKEKYTFNIPLYQRKYAWTSDEVNILLNDLKAAKNKKLTDYFIGNIVVENKDGIFDIIDGQQRFTTLYLMAKIAGQQHYELIYEIRDADREFLEKFTYTDGKKIEYENSDPQFKKNIEAIKDFFTSNNDVKLADLLEICKITLTILPEGIDIVKYFEVMNNRGRQLEKHQILKARFLKVLKEDASGVDYAKIWDYCSNMNLYLEDIIYYNDEKKEDKNFQELRAKLIHFIQDDKIENLKDYFEKGKQGRESILKILEPETKAEGFKEDAWFKTEYSSIVKFPIFLIQVLKMYLANKGKEINDIIVNDGFLMKYFEKYDELLFSKDEAKKFILFLLKMRILYDYFIFKRDEKSEPFLDRLVFGKDGVKFSEGENKNSLMLQLLFNFTAPQFMTQDWIAVVLKWLNNSVNYLRNENFYEEYFKFLENFDRVMAKTRIAEKPLLGQINHYFEKSKFENFDVQFHDSFLNSGTSTPHYWFYKLDYLLWKNDNIWTEKLENKFQESNKFKFNTIKTNFRLSRLNSIEHIHPQNNNDWACIDNFGNLALISNHMNSSLSDKVDSKRGLIQIQLDNGTIESLKMILAYSKYTEWNKDNCQKHQEEMIKILQDDLKE